MSRSYKKVAGGGITTARSDKEYKVLEHRRYRAVIRDLIAHNEDEFFPGYAGTYGNPWGAPKDGKTVWYWSMQYYLANVTICNSPRVGEYYIPWWSSSGTPRRRRVVFERPATRGDWKKLISK